MKVIHCYGKRVDTPTSRYIGRPSIFGNPFPLHNENDREAVLQKYIEYFNRRIDSDIDFKKAVESLRGFDLACWCAPRLCHGDVILDWLLKNGGA